MKSIGDVCELIGGGTPAKDVPSFYSGSVPWATVRDMKNDVIAETEFQITEEAVRRSATNIIPKGNVVIATRVGLGKVCLLAQDTAINQDLRGLIPRESDTLSIRFLYWWFKSIADTIVAQGTGATVQGVKLPFIKSLQIPVPPISAQRRIVALLDEAFAGIAATKANAEKNLQNARALFESHLAAIFSRRARGWEEMTVGDLVSDGALIKPFDGNHGEIHPKKSDYTGSGVPFVMARDLRGGEVDLKNCTFIPRELADSLRVGFAKDGDVLVSHKGSIGLTAIVRTSDDYIMLTPQLTSYRVRDAARFSNRFLRYWFMSPSFQAQLAAGAADGSTRAYIGITKQLSLMIRFPSRDAQDRVVAMLDAIEPQARDLALTYDRKLTLLDKLKTSLLQRAFSGQL